MKYLCLNHSTNIAVFSRSSPSDAVKSFENLKDKIVDVTLFSCKRSISTRLFDPTTFEVQDFTLLENS